MNFDLQNAVTLLIVGVAALYLARSAYKALAGRKAGCGGCGSCPAQKAGEPAVVTLTTTLPKSTDKAAPARPAANPSSLRAQHDRSVV